MSKTSLIIGLLISICAHAVLLLPSSSKELLLRKKAQVLIKPTKKVTLKLSPKAKMQKQPQSAQHLEKNEPKISDLESVVKPSTQNVPDNIGDFSSSDEGDSLPPLRLVWDSPRQLIEISRTLGMRILAVRRNGLVGEISLEDIPHVKAFDGELIGFSNRVRTISAQFFGPDILRTSDEPIESFWVLVPSTLDKQWISVQKQAIKSSSIPGAEVSYMEAKIVTDGHGHKLVITKIVKV
jgi:hypothetical protein